MRKETKYYCDVCDKCYYMEEEARACEKSHKNAGRKPKYSKGDVLHYVEAETDLDNYFIYEDALNVYWDARCKSWIYNLWGDEVSEEAIDLVMTNEERMARIAAIKAKLESANCYDISVTVDSLLPKFSISAYWSKTDKWKR